MPTITCDACSRCNMPTDKSKDLKEMSRQLNSGDVPRSPRDQAVGDVARVGAAILARQKAEQYAEYSDSVGFKWLGDGWKTALAVFSVAAIAISITIRVYDDSRTTPFVASRALPDAEVANVEIQPNELPAPADSQSRPSAEPVQSAVEPERSARVQASPATASDVTIQSTTQVAERQALGFADSRNQRLLNVENQFLRKDI